MRAGVVCVIAVLGLVRAAKVQLVSQTTKGSFNGTSSSILPIPGEKDDNDTINGNMSFYMDVKTGSFRMDIHAMMTEGGKSKLSSTSSKDAAFILSGKTKSLYTFTKDDGCQMIELPNLPEPSQYVACAEDLLQKGKNSSKKEDIYVVEDSTAFNVGPIPFSFSGLVAFQINKDGSIPKIDVGFALIPLAAIAMEWSATESSFGSPDGSIFDVPAEWGNCSKQEMGDVSKLSKTEQEWLKCVQPSLVLADGLVVV